MHIPSHVSYNLKTVHLKKNIDHLDLKKFLRYSCVPNLKNGGSMYDAPTPPDSYFYEEGTESKFGAELASIIKFPPPDGPKGDLTYAQLVCSDQDKAFIYEIITTMSENGKLTLLFQQGHLKQLGAQINHVHPMKFVTTILNNPRLRSCLNDIAEDYFKWNGFMDGLGPSFNREADRGKLDHYINDFAAEMGVTPDAIRKYFQNRDWEGLVKFLMKSPA